LDQVAHDKSGIAPAQDWSVDQLSRRYHAVLVRYFSRRNIDLSDAQDLAQEVFERLSRPEVRARIGRVEGYLFSMAANLAVEHFRYRRVRNAHPNSEFVSDLYRGEEFAPDRLLAGRQELELVVAALDELPERMRHIFVLARLENLSHSEIALRLGVSRRLVQYEVTMATACLADRRSRIT
jgi:RNA polymerase sigma factor (sigma-70 family)